MTTKIKLTVSPEAAAIVSKMYEDGQLPDVVGLREVLDDEPIPDEEAVADLTGDGTVEEFPHFSKTVEYKEPVRTSNTSASPEESSGRVADLDARARMLDARAAHLDARAAALNDGAGKLDERKKDNDASFVAWTYCISNGSLLLLATVAFRLPGLGVFAAMMAHGFIGIALALLALVLGKPSASTGNSGSVWQRALEWARTQPVKTVLVLSMALGGIVWIVFALWYTAKSGDKVANKPEENIIHPQERISQAEWMKNNFVSDPSRRSDDDDEFAFIFVPKQTPQRIALFSKKRLSIAASDLWTIGVQPNAATPWTLAVHSYRITKELNYKKMGLDGIEQGP